MRTLLLPPTVESLIILDARTVNGVLDTSGFRPPISIATGLRSLTITTFIAEATMLALCEACENLAMLSDVKVSILVKRASLVDIMAALPQYWRNVALQLQPAEEDCVLHDKHDDSTFHFPVQARLRQLAVTLVSPEWIDVEDIAENRPKWICYDTPDWVQCLPPSLESLRLLTCTQYLSGADVLDLNWNLTHVHQLRELIVMITSSNKFNIGTPNDIWFERLCGAKPAILMIITGFLQIQGVGRTTLASCFSIHRSDLRCRPCAHSSWTHCVSHLC